MTKRILLKIISKSFPNEKLSSYSQITTGLSDSKIYMVLLQNNEKWIIKVFPKTYFDRIKNQVTISQELIKHKIPTAKTTVENYHTLPNKGFIVMNYLEGTTLHEHLINNTANQKIIHAVGSELSKLHQIPVSDVWQDKSNITKTNFDWARYIKQRIALIDNHKKIYASHKIDVSKIKNQFNIFLSVLKSRKFQLTPLHWDYNPQNILVEKNKVVGILDLESHKVGDPLADIGIFLYWLKYYKKTDLLESFYNGYFKNHQNKLTNSIINKYATLQALVALKHLHQQKDKSKEIKAIVSIIKNSIN